MLRLVWHESRRIFSTDLDVRRPPDQICDGFGPPYDSGAGLTMVRKFVGGSAHQSRNGANSSYDKFWGEDFHFEFKA